jgi:hypothetical protein
MPGARIRRVQISGGQPLATLHGAECPRGGQVADRLDRAAADQCGLRVPVRPSTCSSSPRSTARIASSARTTVRSASILPFRRRSPRVNHYAEPRTSSSVCWDVKPVYLTRRTFPIPSSPTRSFYARRQRYTGRHDRPRPAAIARSTSTPDPHGDRLRAGAGAAPQPGSPEWCSLVVSFLGAGFGHGDATAAPSRQGE